MKRTGFAGYSCASAPKPSAQAPSRPSAAFLKTSPERASASARALLELREHRLGAAHLVLAGRLDVELLHHAVLDQHRVALRAHAHVARDEVELETELLRPLRAAVAEHADLAARLLVAAPGGHHEGVVHGDAPDLVDLFRLQPIVVLDEARDVLGRAGRRVRAGQGEDHDSL